MSHQHLASTVRSVRATRAHDKLTLTWVLNATSERRVESDGSRTNVANFVYSIWCFVSIFFVLFHIVHRFEFWRMGPYWCLTVSQSGVFFSSKVTNLDLTEMLCLLDTVYTLREVPSCSLDVWATFVAHVNVTVGNIYHVDFFVILFRFCFLDGQGGCESFYFESLK